MEVDKQIILNTVRSAFRAGKRYQDYYSNLLSNMDTSPNGDIREPWTEDDYVKEVEKNIEKSLIEK